MCLSYTLENKSLKRKCPFAIYIYSAFTKLVLASIVSWYSLRTDKLHLVHKTKTFWLVRTKQKILNTGHETYNLNTNKSFTISNKKNKTKIPKYLQLYLTIGVNILLFKIFIFWENIPASRYRF